MESMLFALLVCTDTDCRAEYEAYGTPREFDGITCEVCGHRLQAVGWAVASPTGTGPTRPQVQLLDAA
jgi:hypothetical protein